MKKLIIAGIAIGAVCLIARSNSFKVFILRKELKALYAVSKDYEYMNKQGTEVPQWKWDKLKNDRIAILSEIKKLEKNKK